MTRWLMEPDYEGVVPAGLIGWIPRETLEGDREEALRIAVEEYNALGCTAPDGTPLRVEVSKLRAVEVLMREQSDVEARINGQEWPQTVECTSRAKHAVPYWRIERA